MTTAPDTPLISGGPIRHRQPAWSMLPFVGRIAHYWTLVPDPPGFSQIHKGARIREWRAACGITGLTQQGRVDRLEPGNWPRCKTCRRIRKRWEPPA